MMDKVCKDCKQIFDFSEFHKNRSTKDGLARHCKKCHAKRCAELYKSNRTGVADRTKARNEIEKKRSQKLCLDHLLSHPCVDCGESNPIVLDFDHIDSKNKDGCISSMVHYGAKNERIISEIEKCVIRCANCHRKRHARDEGHWKIDALEERNIFI